MGDTGLLFLAVEMGAVTPKVEPFEPTKSKKIRSNSVDPEGSTKKKKKKRSQSEPRPESPKMEVLEAKSPKEKKDKKKRKTRKRKKTRIKTKKKSHQRDHVPTKAKILSRQNRKSPSLQLKLIHRRPTLQL